MFVSLMFHQVLGTQQCVYFHVLLEQISKTICPKPGSGGQELTAAPTKPRLSLHTSLHRHTPRRKPQLSSRPTSTATHLSVHEPCQLLFRKTPLGSARTGSEARNAFQPPETGYMYIWKAFEITHDQKCLCVHHFHVQN